MKATMRAGILAAACVLAAALPAAASYWCGENGVVRFSFVAGDELQPVLRAEPDTNGVTTVDLWVWLTDVDPVQLQDEALLAVGGFELELEVEGAEAFIIGKEFPAEGINVARDQWGCVIGLNPNPGLKDGRCLLVKYTLMFQGRPQNVRFVIAEEGIISCGTIEGCPGSRTRALWIGPTASNMLGEVFGAGCEPAWLNPEGEPDLTPLRGVSTWQDVGRFEARPARR